MKVPRACSVVALASLSRPDRGIRDAFGVNDRGEVVGRLFDGSTGGGGFVWRDGVVVGRYHFDPNRSDQHGILWLKAATRAGGRP